MLKFHSLRIAESYPDAEDAVALALQVPEALRGEYSGLAGQHVVLRAELDGAETRRTYSLVNSPGEWPLRIVARVHPQGRMSRHLAAHLKAGDYIDVLPPNGSLTWRVTPAARLFVGFASGCGITPILSILRTVLQSNPDNRVILFYGNSDTTRAMCLEELLGLKDRYLQRLAIHFVMSRESQEVELYNGRLDGGRVSEFARTMFRAADVAEFFICGPGDMIEQVGAALRGLGVAADRIHGEHFTVGAGAEPEASAVAPAFEDTARALAAAAPSLAPAPGSSVVTVLMDGRRRTFNMQINEETVLDAATRAGLELPFSCQAGVCSTCRTKVVTGRVRMDQNYALEDWELEQGYVLACQARVETATLELDYDEK